MATPTGLEPVTCCLEGETRAVLRAIPSDQDPLPYDCTARLSGPAHIERSEIFRPLHADLLSAHSTSQWVEHHPSDLAAAFNGNLVKSDSGLSYNFRRGATLQLATQRLLIYANYQGCFGPVAP